MTTWYRVTSTYNDDDSVTAAITDVLESAEKPANGAELFEGKQVWVDWFENQEEAELFVAAVLAEDDEE